MPASSPVARPADPGTFARTTITIVMAVIAALAFVFSFGNVWTLALRLGVPHPVAPLIAPMVDLSVVGLLVAQHYLAATGTDPAQLRSATRLMHLCGLLTLVLNTAEPLLARHFGRAALDTVAPALLLGWGTVGPTLLRHLHIPTTTTALSLASTDHTPSTETPAASPQPAPESAQGGDAQAAPSDSVDASSAEPEPVAPRKRTGRKPAATMDQLIEIARPAVAEHGATLAVVKKAVRDSGTPIASGRLGELLQHLKDAQTAAEPEMARAHPAVD
ncbi:DUF2637 domain-containing protein [Kitasatospora sp. MAP5-34]|uniref:DUF2637 domain-containing protein n=1 Tax=Kitasatospora sp. MAP5-34 TaxID=3035102 RepID=UPI002476AC07|nr:DUF2637 domain-containing protein [Kitasatospora sp. MAP5-34]MDH6577557.1 hypothetical protein [Kitasatospora sp. MAP5-34]